MGLAELLFVLLLATGVRPTVLGGQHAPASRGCWGWSGTQGQPLSCTHGEQSPPSMGTSAGSHTLTTAVMSQGALALSSAQKQLYPEVHPHLLTFFLTARGCSVARITRSFCSAPPSIASIWTLGLLQGKKQRAGHQQSGAWQGGTDSRSVWGSTPQRTQTSVNPARPQSKPLQLPPTTVCSYGEGAKPCRPSQTQHMTDAA